MGKGLFCNRNASRRKWDNLTEEEKDKRRDYARKRYYIKKEEKLAKGGLS